MADLTHLRSLRIEDMSELAYRIEKAVRAAFGDGLPRDIACVVSGGVDSSTVTAFARKIDPTIKTYTGYYDTEGFDERLYARLVTDRSFHTEVLITPQDFVDNFDEFATHMKPPFQGMGAFGQYMVGKRMAADGVKVALSGEGSDELFGGYARLIAVAGGTLPDGYENYKVPDGYPKDIKAALDYDYQRLPDLLAVDDQCMNAHGIEARAPFTDPDVVAYGLTLPIAERVGKTHLKEAVAGIVPRNILARTDKRGFPIPLNQWAQGPCKDFIEERIGYIPDPDHPWDRTFWYDLLNRSNLHAVAA